MKIALITDIHFGARNDSPQFLDYYQKFYDEIFFPKLKEENIKNVLILGDTFDRRKYVNFHSLKRAKEMFFLPLQDQCDNVYMLAGNHDTYFKNTNEVNSIDLLLNDYSNLHILSYPEDIYIDNHLICMMPWICQENFEESMQLLKETKASICCGHFEIQGFAMYRGMQSEEGLERKLFKKFDFTFSGHYHHKSTDDDIYYLGNPYELTWHDYNDERGFHILDLDTRELEFIRNPNRMFYKIDYDDKKESSLEISSKDLSEYTNKYVKVVIEEKNNPFVFDQFMNKLYDVNPIDVTIVEDVLDFSDDDEEDVVKDAEDTVTIINKYIDALENEGIDNNKMKKLMSELYVEAINLE